VLLERIKAAANPVEWSAETKWTSIYPFHLKRLTLDFVNGKEIAKNRHRAART
jgi:hypothetical protein